MKILQTNDAKRISPSCVTPQAGWENPMKLSIIKLTSIATLGLAVVACQPNAEDKEIDAAADDLFAPVEVSSNAASQAVFPENLSNTEVAVNESQDSVSASGTATNSTFGDVTNSAVSTAVQSQSLIPNQKQNQSTVSQQDTELKKISTSVFVKPSEPNSIMTRSVQSNPVVTQKTSNQSCAAPTSKAALAAYAAHCTNSIQHSQIESSMANDGETTITTAPKKITTTTTQHLIGEEPKVTRVVRTFAPVDISCSEAPTTKAGLAAYRANCLKRVGAPVRLSSEQTYIRPTSSSTTSSTDNITTDNITSEKVTSTVSIETNNSDALNAAPLDTDPESSESMNNALPSATEMEIEESPIAPSGSALFDCSKDPSTGAELALFRAYCEG